MAKFCESCGSELNEIQDICLGCGRVLNKNNINNVLVKKDSNHRGYIITSGIIMIVVGACMILGMNDEIYDFPILVFGLPGLVGIISGVFSLCSKNSRNLLLLSGIFYLVGALINFIGIIDISIFMILSVIFGILNIVYSRNK